MPDDTTAAIQALIQQVTALTETVQTQQKHIAALKADILDEKKDALREKDTALSSVDKILAQLETQQREKALKLAGFERDASGNLVLGGGRAERAVYLTREEARDPVKYREAKAKAEASGLPLRVTDTGEDPTRRNTGQREIMKSAVFTFDDEHERVRYVRADMQTGNGIVQRRLQAEKEGYTIRTFRTLDDLPEHAARKFTLMEKAANHAETET
ncbi:hypothetical protein K7H22_01450 [Seohaeicola saemankumensis]|uniref:hypothetical protein n=1 Tax=Seohaeicola saemankumensis TaxID=481181 RepID=UPI001E659045|nr:hypothetical protein [Seohaeicola saemankumensis]MCD1624657.1 hypothetical protein [Seohaeicola saemankumensis]